MEGDAGLAGEADTSLGVGVEVEAAALAAGFTTALVVAGTRIVVSPLVTPLPAPSAPAPPSACLAAAILSRSAYESCGLPAAVDQAGGVAVVVAVAADVPAVVAGCCARPADDDATDEAEDDISWRGVRSATAAGGVVGVCS